MKALFILVCLSFVNSAFANPCPKPWNCENFAMTIPYDVGMFGTKTVNVTIRAGVLRHAGTFKGNIIYYEGLGDSMLNHMPMFKKLTGAGYQVIAFDYMGQGGSSGSMNDTKIQYISHIGHAIWKNYAINLEKISTKTIIGWSTGGLAAYFAAAYSTADRVVLIAPGIAPNKVVGGGLTSLPPNRITMESLTTDSYGTYNVDPHLEVIKPISPIMVPHFATNLLISAFEASSLTIHKSVKGLVLLSGDKDTYVHATKTKTILSKMASHFKVIQYPDALHEIDNERKDIRDQAHKDILNFLR